MKQKSKDEHAKTREADAKAKYTIVEVFRDKHNFDKKWVPGDDISHFEPERIAYLIEKGFIK